MADKPLNWLIVFLAGVCLGVEFSTKIHPEMLIMGIGWGVLVFIWLLYGREEE